MGTFHGRRINTGTKYGFIQFEKEEEAKEAISKMDGVPIFGCVIRVKKCYEGEKEKIKKTEGGAFIKKTEGDGSKKSEKEKGGSNFFNSRRMANNGGTYAEVLKGDMAGGRRKEFESARYGEGEGSRVGGCDEEVEGDKNQKTVRIGVYEWNVFKEDQHLLREKVYNLEIICRNLEEEVKK